MHAASTQHLSEMQSCLEKMQGEMLAALREKDAARAELRIMENRLAFADKMLENLQGQIADLKAQNTYLFQTILSNTGMKSAPPPPPPPTAPPSGSQPSVGGASSQ